MLDISAQLAQLRFVFGAKLLQLHDLPAQADLGLRCLSARPDLRVEVVFEVGVALGERVAWNVGFLGQSDDRQRAGGVLRGLDEAAQGDQA
ncbi:hypothetical protein [Streptomyces sp. NPDC048188]|uniref:hypothetical protein n=1 Tax=Streptomyces sp. NPDC048188 TaxID=3155749 RepID=UPI00343369EA